MVVGRLSQPFLKVRSTESASGKDAQRLYEQASSISLISYLLFGAAEPLSKVTGSSGALLPYLSPRTLHVYASQPGICSSTLVEQLYGLSQSLYGTPALQACHYGLLNALRAVFAWVADNVPLTFQQVPGQPSQSIAAWPDLSTISDADFSAAVNKALLTQAELAETATLLTSGRCGLDIPTFSSLVPSISSALTQLHADLAELQTIGDATYSPAIAEPPTLSSIRRRLVIDEAIDNNRDDSSGGGSTSRPADVPRLFVDENDEGLLAVINNKRRNMQAETAADLPEYVFDMPPAGFPAQPPSAVPKVLIGLVFHVMQYKERNGGIAPLGYEQSPGYAEHMVQIVNYISKPTNFSFFLRDVRYNTSEYPYLLVKNRKTWLEMGSDTCRQDTVDCLWTPGGIVSK
ncbi:hypothetical protein PLESTM_001014700 [Pleodorina starrii]|nr:hypothetical protein PLESTM_001014700 [Pleodorina starrii]